MLPSKNPTSLLILLLFVCSSQRVISSQLRVSKAQALLKNTNSVDMIHAAEADDIEKIEKLLAQGFSINSVNSLGHTPLYVATWQGRFKVVLYLLTNNADTSVQVKSGDSLMHAAVFSSKKELIMALRLKGVPTNSLNRDNIAPFQFALQLGLTEIAYELIIDDKSETPLVRAVLAGDRQEVMQLIQNNASIDQCGSNGMAPLHIAAFIGDADMADILMEKGATPGIKDSREATPLHLAVQSGARGIVSSLLKKNNSLAQECDKDNYAPIERALRFERCDIVEELLPFWPSLSGPDPAGVALIHLATVYKNLTMVRFLKNKGADWTTKLIPKGLNEKRPTFEKATTPGAKKKEWSILEIAASIDFAELVKELLASGEFGGVDEIRREWMTLLHIAAQSNAADVIIVLTDLGAQINAVTIDAVGNTPLHEAVTEGHETVVKLLLANGALVNLPNANGMTPYFLAVIKYHSNCAYFLAKQGAIKDRVVRRTAPFFHAIRIGHVEGVRTFLERGSSVSEVGEDGRITFLAAHFHNQEKVVLLLLEYAEAGPQEVRDEIISLKKSDTDSVLHQAASQGILVIVQRLVAWGAEVNSVLKVSNDISLFPQTPLYYAVQGGHDRIVQFLIDKGADTTIHDERGTTLIDIATTHGRSTCMELLEKILNVGLSKDKSL